MKSSTIKKGMLWALRCILIVLVIALACLMGWYGTGLICAILGPTVLAYAIIILGLISFTILVSTPLWFLWRVTAFQVWMWLDCWIIGALESFNSSHDFDTDPVPAFCPS